MSRLATPPEEEHEIDELIPWYVNGTLRERDRLRVETHVALCVQCREALAREQRVFQHMSSDPAVEYMPAASLKCLNAALDAASSAGAGAGANPRVPLAGPGRPRLWASAAAASLAAAALVWGLGKFDRGARDLPSQYHTVTTATPRQPGEVIRAVFAPNMTVEQLQTLLNEAGLRIVAGPTEAGVYSLALASGRSVSESLILLRRNATVRFAEISGEGEEGVAAHRGARP
jgi:anti-sigma-K factor RskA